jgi:hypothetical protein
MNITRRIAQFVSSPTFVRLSMLGLTVALGIVWGDHTINGVNGVIWGS